VGKIGGKISFRPDALGVARGGRAMGFGIVRIDLQRLAEQFEGGRLSLSRKRVYIRKRVQVEIIRVEIIRPLASGPFHLRSPQAGFDRSDDTGNNPVLKIEDILE